MSVGRLLRSFVMILSLAAIATPVAAKTVTIDTEPVKGGRISIDGSFVGVAPVTKNLKLAKHAVALVSAEKAGSVSPPGSTLRLDKSSKGLYLLRLEDDPAWKETEQSDVANKWLTIQAKSSLDKNDEIDEDLVWQKTVSLVSDNFSDLEQMDRGSFYLRSAWRVRVFPNSTMRNRLVVKRGASSDLSIKLQLESQVCVHAVATPGSRASSQCKEADSFEDTDRIFIDDKETLDYLRDQL